MHGGTDGGMDGQRGGGTDGGTDGRTDGRTDGQTNRWVDERTVPDFLGNAHLFSTQKHAADVADVQAQREALAAREANLQTMEATSQASPQQQLTAAAATVSDPIIRSELEKVARALHDGAARRRCTTSVNLSVRPSVPPSIRPSVRP